MSDGLSIRFWLITLATITAVAVTFRLGLWQLDRASQRVALQAAIEQRQGMPPVAQDALLKPDAKSELLHRPVVLRGRWLARYTVFLDNRQMEARQGFYVVTPMQLDGDPGVVLVERGWVPRNFEQRDKLPVVQTPPGHDRTARPHCPAPLQAI